MLAQRPLRISESDPETNRKYRFKSHAASSLSIFESEVEDSTGINNNLLLVRLNLNAGVNKQIEASLYTVRHISDNKNQLPSTMMVQMHTLFQENDRNWDIPPTLAELMTAQAEDWTLQKHVATGRHPDSKL